MNHWPFNRYATAHHTWSPSLLSLNPNSNSNSKSEKDRFTYYRPLGLVERTFDADGIYFGGRADINASLDLSIHSTLSPSQLRKRILLAWTALRLQHVLLMTSARDGEGYGLGEGERCFVIHVPGSAREAVKDAEDGVVFIGDEYENIEYEEFYYHLQNAGRVLDAEKGLARLFVLPTVDEGQGRGRLRFIFVMAHQITDGLTNHTWLQHFIHLVNQPLATLQQTITKFSTRTSVERHLPQPQEDLYPVIKGSTARKRWFWAIAIVLRHIKKPQPACFQNPLRLRNVRASRLPEVKSFERLLKYTGKPPTTNTCQASATLSRAATLRLHDLCRAANVSVGAGCFVLVAITMMQMHESQTSNLDPSQRLPFIGSFPINPRPFFSHHAAPDSLMLAFSDGVVLPFLPSSLPLVARFRLLVLQAQRQLRRYQKRQSLTSSVTAPQSQILPNLHLQLAAMLVAKITPLSNTFNHTNPSASLPPTPNPTMATCGVSSIGRSLWKQGEYDLNAALRPGEDAFVADFRENMQNVRAREGEFLVGIVGGDRIVVNVSYDEGAMDERLVREWTKLLNQVLVDSGTAKL